MVGTLAPFPVGASSCVLHHRRLCLLERPASRGPQGSAEKVCVELVVVCRVLRAEVVSDVLSRGFPVVVMIDCNC